MTDFKFKVGDHVRKVGGSYQGTGVIKAAFRADDGTARYVFRFDNPPGLLHIFNEGNLEKIDDILNSRCLVDMNDFIVVLGNNEITVKKDGGKYLAIYPSPTEEKLSIGVSACLIGGFSEAEAQARAYVEAFVLARKTWPELVK